MTKEEKKAERSNREGIVEVCFIDFFIAYETPYWQWGLVRMV
jgi:hypothetical protein